jgi:hypothetical protein
MKKEIMGDVFVTTPDHQEGKIVKYFRPNPIGEDVYLESDGVTVTRDEDKIINAQRIFKNNYYKPGGKGALRVLKRLREANLGHVLPTASAENRN